jgi:hypothetical protein
LLPRLDAALDQIGQAHVQCLTISLKRAVWNGRGAKAQRDTTDENSATGAARLMQQPDWRSEISTEEWFSFVENF